MNGHPDDGRLNDWIDGVLPGEDADAVAAHVASCPACTAEAEALRELLADARALARSIDPARDLWAGVSERIARQDVVSLASARNRREGAGASPWAGRIALAAAAGLLVVASSAVTLLVVRARGETPVATATATATAALPPGLHLVSEVEAGYADAVQVLERSLDAGRDELRPETITVIEENLRIIDEAIATASAALMNDPANLELAQTLRHAYRQKVGLLERAVRLRQI